MAAVRVTSGLQTPLPAMQADCRLPVVAVVVVAVVAVVVVVVVRAAVGHMPFVVDTLHAVRGSGVEHRADAAAVAADDGAAVAVGASAEPFAAKEKKGQKHVEAQPGHTI